jgi:hypothetical protein
MKDMKLWIKLTIICNNSWGETSMRKIPLVLLIFMFVVSLFMGCSNNSVDKGKKISSIEIIRQSDEKEWILSDKDIIDKFTKALNDRQETNSKIDIRPQDYFVKIYFTDESNKEYGLWVDEDINVRGVLINEDTTWFINKESNPIFKEILK